MADQFGNQTQFGGAFKANAASLTFSIGAGGNGGLGLLVQQVQAGYQQALNRIWELGNGNRTYFVAGRAQGSMGVARIIGPEAISDAFVQQYANVCRAKDNVLRINASPGMCGSSGGVDRTFENVVINSISLQMAAADMLIQEQMGAAFHAMSNSKSGSARATALSNSLNGGSGGNLFAGTTVVNF